MLTGRATLKSALAVSAAALFLLVVRRARIQPQVRQSAKRSSQAFGPSAGRKCGRLLRYPPGTPNGPGSNDCSGYCPRPLLFAGGPGRQALLSQLSRARSSAATNAGSSSAGAREGRDILLAVAFRGFGGAANGQDDECRANPEFGQFAVKLTGNAISDKWSQNLSPLANPSSE